jgi:uncharacterized membrane protein
MAHMSAGDARQYTPPVRQAEVLDVAAAVVAVGLILLAAADTGGLIRSLLALLFTFFVPGRAIVSNWRRMADWSGIGMSIALSLALLVVLATVSLWVHYWHPLGLFQLEAFLSLIGLGTALVRRRRQPEALAD